MSKDSEVDTLWAEIHIAGDYRRAVNFCHDRVTDASFCVSVIPADYVYNGGIQSGVRIRLIHYPKYPATLEDIRARARNLAEGLRVELNQYSYTVEDSEKTHWYDCHPNN